MRERRDLADHHDEADAAARAPGKRTRTVALQRQAAPPATAASPVAQPTTTALDAPFALHLAADHDTRAGGAPLPHLDAIQASFGRHAVGHVTAHVGGAATDACDALGAQAYATGDRVAFAAPPDLHTAAHEAAHVVQQRGGVQLRGGVGADGDPYERHADAVADRVVRGESAEALLDAHAGAGAPAGPALQRKPSALRAEYGKHPLVALPLGKRLHHPGWNAYLIELERYLVLGDGDLDDRRRILGSLYPRATSLVRDRTGDQDFTDAQHQLALELNQRIEGEKHEVYGSTAGMMLPAHDVATIIGPDPELEGQRGYTSQDDPRWFPLFTKPPSIADVQQGGLGDCYLLAAVAIVAERDPMHFVQHLADNLDGTVTVRLYRDVDTPLQVVVEKSVPGNRFARNVLWVKLLEKAYAASGLAAGNREAPRRYRDLEGGSSSAALTHLTGKASGTVGIGRTRNRINQGIMNELQHEEQALRQRLEVLRDRDDELTKQITRKQLLDPQADVSTERGELERIAQDLKPLMQQIGELQNPIFDIGARLSMMLVTGTSFREFIATHRDNEAVQRILAKVVPLDQREGLFPEAVGTGIYGVDEAHVFEAIKAGIDRGKPMTAGTKISIADRDNKVEGQGQSGEPKVKGLAGKHAYSLLDYKPKLDLAHGQRTFIQLRNPWGEYGRRYEELEGGLLKAVAFDGDGTFWIDLADFVANFRDVNWAG